MNKIIFVFILTFIFSISLISKPKPNIGVVIYRYDDNFIYYVRKSIDDIAKSKANILIRNSQNSQAMQNDLVDMMLDKNVDALAVNLVNRNSSKYIIEQAKARNIPIVFFNREPLRGELGSYKNAWYIGGKPEDAGTMQGKIIANSLKKKPSYDKNKDGIIQYVMLQGDLEHNDTLYRSHFVTNYLINNGVKIKELDKEVAFWEKARANNITKKWLDEYGDKIEYIISNNDAMALGALMAIRDSGYNLGDPDKFIPIVGVDGLPDFVKEIKYGAAVGTVLQDPKEHATAIVEVLFNVANGIEPLENTKWVFDDGKSIRLPYKIITEENVSLAEDAYFKD